MSCSSKGTKHMWYHFVPMTFRSEKMYDFSFRNVAKYHFRGIIWEGKIRSHCVIQILKYKIKQIGVFLSCIVKSMRPQLSSSVKIVSITYRHLPIQKSHRAFVPSNEHDIQGSADRPMVYRNLWQLSEAGFFLLCQKTHIGLKTDPLNIKGFIKRIHSFPIEMTSAESAATRLQCEWA